MFTDNVEEKDFEKMDPEYRISGKKESDKALYECVRIPRVILEGGMVNRLA